MLYYIMFETSAFQALPLVDGSPVVPDVHVGSQYRITDKAGNALFDSGETYDLLQYQTDEPLLNIPEDGKVLLLARHKGAKLGWSGWSDPVEAAVTEIPKFGNCKEFTNSGSFTWQVPAGVSQVMVLCVGGGGSGAAGAAANAQYGGAGGAGGKGGGFASAIINVVPYASIPVQVGGISTTGGSSSFGSWLMCSGGTSAARGYGTITLPEGAGSLICNLASTPADKSCPGFLVLQLHFYRALFIVANLSIELMLPAPI